MKEVIIQAIELIAPHNNKKVLAQNTYTISKGYQQAFSCGKVDCLVDAVSRLKNPTYIQAVSDRCYCSLFLFTTIDSVEQDLSELKPLCNNANDIKANAFQIHRLLQCVKDTIEGKDIVKDLWLFEGAVNEFAKNIVDKLS